MKVWEVCNYGTGEVYYSTRFRCVARAIIALARRSEAPGANWLDYAKHGEGWVR